MGNFRIKRCIHGAIDCVFGSGTCSVTGAFHETLTEREKMDLADHVLILVWMAFGIIAAFALWQYVVEYLPASQA